MTIILDPGHGMSNIRRNQYDTGACAGGAEEASIAMDWVNELRANLKAAGHTVVRTRIDAKDPAPVWRRDDIAAAYHGDRMISIHCNSGGGTGSECFYRGADDKELAQKLSVTTAHTLGIKDRGVKTEKESQHTSLAVMEFDKCWLIELGFIDNPIDRQKLLDPVLRKATCEALAQIIVNPIG